MAVVSMSINVIHIVISCLCYAVSSTSDLVAKEETSSESYNQIFSWQTLSDIGNFSPPCSMWKGFGLMESELCERLIYKLHHTQESLDIDGDFCSRKLQSLYLSTRASMTSVLYGSTLRTGSVVHVLGKCMYYTTFIFPSCTELTLLTSWKQIIVVYFR